MVTMMLPSLFLSTSTSQNNHLLTLQYLRIIFIGGCFVEGDQLRNAFRWKETIGPWEERPGHYGDFWKYWTDDGLGYFEFLQVNFD
jgi:alpha-N-arabinofuranosidase